MSTTTQTASATNQAPATIKRFQEETVAKVLEKVNTFRANGEIRLPANYSPENALKSAWLILQDTVDRNDKPVLEVCTPASIANALLDMVIKGLSPVKKQCYFIAYGNELSCDESYFGKEVTAKRVGNVKEIKARAIYQDDEFEYETDAATGRNKIIKHVQRLENIDHEKVKGAYAIITFNDGSIDVEIMSMKQIRQAWMQGPAKGNSPAHRNFADEMAEKTVISRACKGIINSTDDADLFREPETPKDPVIAGVKGMIADKANREEIGFDTPINVKAAEPVPSDVQTQAEPAVNGQATLNGPGF